MQAPYVYNAVVLSYHFREARRDGEGRSVNDLPTLVSPLVRPTPTPEAAHTRKRRVEDANGAALKRVATEVDLQRMDNQLTESAQPTRGPADSMQLLVNVAKATNLQQHGRVGIV